MSKMNEPHPSDPTEPAPGAPAQAPPSTVQLLRWTGIAAAVAAVLLLVAVLPAEYGIDPTGIGRALGLTQMGEMKAELAKEEARHATPVQTPSATTPSAPTAPAPGASSSSRAVATQDADPSASESKSDVTKVTLAPNESTEVKLTMVKGARATYTWSVEGGDVNYDLHADRSEGGYHSYKKGKGAREDRGDFVAAFDGRHGWFWRNRSTANVTITLETSGEYTEVKQLD